MPLRCKTGFSYTHDMFRLYMTWKTLYLVRVLIPFRVTIKHAICILQGKINLREDPPRGIRVKMFLGIILLSR